MITPGTWRGVLALIAVGAGLGLGYNALNPKPLPWIAEAKKGVSLDALTQAPEAEASGSVTEDPLLSPALPPETKTEAKVVPQPETKPAAALGTKPETVAPEIKPVTAAPSTKADPYPEIPASEFPIEVKLAQAVALYNRGGLLVLDARDPEEFVESHIQGAVSAPYNSIAGDTEWFDKIAKEPRPILAYCGGGHCELSMDLAFEIIRAGHQRVLVLMDGFPAWQEAGHPVKTGETP